VSKLIVLQKAVNYKDKLQKLMDQRGDTPDARLEKFRKLILDHLDALNNSKEEKAIQKAFSSMIYMAKGGKGLAVGTVREWKGKKFKKFAPGKWLPVYDSETRGAKIAVSAIKRKIAASKDVHEMMQIILENRGRFSDKNGQPLPFVQDLSKYAAGEQDRREQGTKEQKKAKPATGDKKDSGIERKKYSRGSREQRLERVKDDYIRGEITKEAAAGLYTRIFPKMTEEAALKVINNLWEDRKKGKQTKKKADANIADTEIETHSKRRKSRQASDFTLKYRKDGDRMFVENTNKKEVAGDDETLGFIDDNGAVFYQSGIEDIPAEIKNEIEKHGAEIQKGRNADIMKRGRAWQKTVDDWQKASQEYTKFKQEVDRAKQSGEYKKYPSDYDERLRALKSKQSKAAKAKNEARADLGDDYEIFTIIQRDYKEDESEKKPSKVEYSDLKNASGNENEKSDFEKIQDKYKTADFEEGDDDQIQVGKELIGGRWKLVEADTPTASHDEATFHKTPGFPVNDDGSTINDRDYGHDVEAQGIVMEIGGDYDGRAVSVDNPVIVTKDGIVISGNNRTMSSKIAARKGSDTGYIEALKRKAKKFGFTPEQIDKFKHPRVIFETSENKDYSTDQFAKFNKSSKKAMSPIESAVKVSKTIKTETVESIAGKMSDFETLGELYADRNVINDIFNTLQKDNIITSMDRPQYVVEGGITGAGKEFLETVLIGSVINESNIRGLNREGCKSIRQKLVRAITPLVENKGMDGYSITKELNEAVDIAMQIATQKDKFKTIDDYTSQKKLFGVEDDPIAVELVRKLAGTQKEFAAFMQTMNGGLKPAASGEADIFLGNVESREDILGRMLNLKKSIGNVIDFFRNLRTGKGLRFVKKAVPIVRKGEMIQEERWLRDTAKTVNIDNTTDILNTGRKTIAIDFDGVINSFSNGWRGPTETDAPVEGAMEAISALLAADNKVVIYSTRAATPEGRETILRYLTGIGTAVNDIEVTDKKPLAHVYIDDRAIPFSGDWSDALKQIEEFKPWMEKSLTFSGYPLQGRTKVHGMDISIENKKGSIRNGTDKDGHDWSIKMNFDYGYIRGTVGRDKDHVDCYLGPNLDVETVFIVHQNDPVTGKYDEDKVMLGFETEEEAKKAYLSQYDRQGFMGDIATMDIDTFKKKAFDPNNKGKKLV
jgi:hypothetical protein